MSLNYNGGLTCRGTGRSAQLLQCNSPPNLKEQKNPDLCEVKLWRCVFHYMPSMFYPHPVIIILTQKRGIISIEEKKNTIHLSVKFLVHLAFLGGTAVAFFFIICNLLSAPPIDPEPEPELEPPLPNPREVVVEAAKALALMGFGWLFPTGGAALLGIVC